MSDESCRGDFIGDGDLIPLAHGKAKTDCQKYLDLWADSASVYVEWEGRIILDAPGQPTDGLAGRPKQILTETSLSYGQEDNASSDNNNNNKTNSQMSGI